MTESIHPIAHDDPFLRMIVAQANAGIECGITIQCAGGLVTGKVTGQQEYFDAIAELMEGAARRGDMEKSPYAAELRKLRASQAGSSEYIHLRDARILTGDKYAAQNTVWWRARLSAISGFCIGLLSDDAPSA